MGRKKPEKKSEKIERIREREWMKEKKTSFSLDAPYTGYKKPFIGFTIWTPITHFKDE